MPRCTQLIKIYVYITFLTYLRPTYLVTDPWSVGMLESGSVNTANNVFPLIIRRLLNWTRSNPPLPNPSKSFIATKSTVVNPTSRSIVAVHSTYMGATKINHEQNHIGAIVDYLERIDRGGLHRDTEILRY